MTPNKLKSIQKKYRLTGKQMAKLFGVSSTTISLYKSGNLKLSRTADFIERLEAFDRLSDEGKAQQIQSILHDDVSYQKSLIVETGKIARALVKQHGYAQIDAFMLAHCSRYKWGALTMSLHIAEISIAYQKADGNTPLITVAQLKELIKAAQRNGMPRSWSI